jgi:hypothetical protein
VRYGRDAASFMPVSWVSTMMISVHPVDVPVVWALSDWLDTAAPCRAGHRASSGDEIRGVGSLRDLAGADGWGGWKAPECWLWAGALNYADLNAVLAWVANAHWQRKEIVQLFLCDQEEMTFRLHMYRDGRWRQYAPTDT